MKEDIYKVLYNKNPNIPAFSILPQINKQETRRPIVNGINSITERTSTYIDEEIRPLSAQDNKLYKDTMKF